MWGYWEFFNRSNTSIIISGCNDHQKIDCSQVPLCTISPAFSSVLISGRWGYAGVHNTVLLDGILVPNILLVLKKWEMKIIETAG